MHQQFIDMGNRIQLRRKELKTLAKNFIELLVERNKSNWNKNNFV